MFWHSLKQLNLVVAFEEEFEIKLNDNEIIEMLNYPFIIEVVKNK